MEEIDMSPTAVRSYLPRGSTGRGQELMTFYEHEMEVEHKTNDFNHYSTSKSVSQNMLNISTIQGHISIMVNLFATAQISSSGNIVLSGFQIALIVLIGISLILQFLIFIFLVLLAKSKTDNVNLGAKSCTTSDLNSTVTR